MDVSNKEFDPSAYLGEVSDYLNRLPSRHVPGGTRTKTFGDMRLFDENYGNGRDMAGEHWLSETYALEQLGEAADPGIADQVQHMVGDVSRASAVMESQDPRFTRFGRLTEEQRGGVVAAIINSATEGAEHV